MPRLGLTDSRADRAERLLEVRNLGKTFSGQAALSGFDLSLTEGEVCALLGENGSGKSTFIKILSGFHVPDSGGSVTVAGKRLPFGQSAHARALGARFVHQDLGLVSSSSVADNMCLDTGFPRRFGTISTRRLMDETAAQLQALGLNIDPAQPVSTLSPAMKTGVAVARALKPSTSTPVRLLVLDEPTATLPDHEVNELLELVRTVASKGVGVIYVSHRIDEVFDIAHRAVVLRNGIKVADLPVAALDRPKLIELLVGEQLAQKLTQPAATAVSEEARAVLRVHNLHSAPLRGVDLEVASGEVVGIAGLTGSGRETLLGALFGARVRQQGAVSCAGTVIDPGDVRGAIRAGMAFLPAERKSQGGMLELSAAENMTITDVRRFRSHLSIKRKAEAAEVRSWFEQLAIRPLDGEGNPLGWFSGGNQQKILLAKWLRCRPQVLLLDEPTQGVDIGARALIHDRIREAAADGAAVVVSSSDHDELVTICNRVLVVRRGRVEAEVRGEFLTEHDISRHSLGSQEAIA